ncbi:type IV pilin N-terminal domain-containing protein [Halorientalis salina]|uniref:type IV pilin N-terminal domain-containing protein n=1 Tax=Halorientalis salina TaxID=2932266 RepID=UPI0010ABAB41|nr:type IV pilin N-terminal domain-containing protein [Halorientalis salina]
MSTRATSSVVGVALLVGITVLSTAAVGTAVLDIVPSESGPPRVSFTASADAADDRIALTHRSGESLTVSDLRIEVRIDGEPLAKQPPVPFFAAAGFESGPTGPFNAAADGTWRAGQTAAIRIAATNSPQLSAGAVVTIRIYTEQYQLASVTATA